MKATYSGHERIEKRSIALHRAIAEKIRSKPELLEIARDNLARWMQKGGRSQPYWDAWTELLARPLPELLQQLTEDSERMRALRQATPFAGVLSPSERWAVYDLFKSPGSTLLTGGKSRE
jgi:hypothetical protein